MREFYLTIVCANKSDRDVDVTLLYSVTLCMARMMALFLSLLFKYLFCLFIFLPSFLASTLFIYLFYTHLKFLIQSNTVIKAINISVRYNRDIVLAWIKLISQLGLKIQKFLFVTCYNKV